MCSLTVLETKSLRSRCQQAALFPKSLAGSPFLAFQLLGAVSVPQLVATFLPASSSCHLPCVSLKTPSTLLLKGYQWLHLSPIWIHQDKLLGASPVAQLVKNLSANAGDEGSTPFCKEWNGNPLKYFFLFFFHSSILVWKIPWTEEPNRLQSPWGHKESDTTEYAHTQSSLT